MCQLSKIFLYIFFTTIIYSKITAQVNFARYDTVVVTNISGDTLENPWAGGFNSVQFSEIDLNLDGVKDLFVFDRTGNRMSTFINNGLPNQISYTHDPSYQSLFPANLHSWVLLRDYNCDGKMDIFTSSNVGIAVYRNTSTTQLSFALDTNQIYSDNQPDSINPVFIQIFVAMMDIPVIDDIDNDGDLDFLISSIIGDRIEYHKNLSMEKNGNCNSLDFQLRNKCWGYTRESTTQNIVTFYDTCSNNIANPEKTTPNNKHVGGTSLFTLDVDANNSKELVLGGNSHDNLLLLINDDISPNLDASNIISQDTAFPQNNLNTLPIDMAIFPAGYYFDLNNDNIKDLVAATNCASGCNNANNVWYYENADATNKPDFNFITDAFIQDGMIEVGEGAHPVFFDYNSDGLVDLVVGSYGKYNPNFTLAPPIIYESSLWLFENIGSASVPIFHLVDKDYAGISSINLDLGWARPTLGLSPTFGDLDGDGDMDMILGDYKGVLHYFDNTAGTGNPAIFSLLTPEYLNIDVGSDATPLLYDLNNDLLLDLIIGSRNGTFTYYANSGTTTIPNYTLITDSLGKVTTMRTNEFQGNSNPVIVDSSGTTILFSGSESGFIYKFGNIDGNLGGTFSVDSSFLNIWDGITTYISMADVTSDGNLDMLLGNYSGGVAFYKGDSISSVGMVEQYSNESLSIYPNPTFDQLKIDTDLNIETISILDITGKTLKIITPISKTINVEELSNGIYFLRVISEQGSIVQKFIKN